MNDYQRPHSPFEDSATDRYITSADYVGEVTRSDVESVTYRLTYLDSVVTSEKV